MSETSETCRSDTSNPPRSALSEYRDLCFPEFWTKRRRAQWIRLNIKAILRRRSFLRANRLLEELRLS